MNFIDPTGLFFQDLIANYTTPKQQAIIGASLTGLGLFLAGQGIKNPNIIGLGITGFGLAIGLEGVQNVIKAGQRSFDEIKQGNIGQNNNLNSIRCEK